MRTVTTHHEVIELDAQDLGLAVEHYLKAKGAWREGAVVRILAARPNVGATDNPAFVTVRSDL